MPSMVEVQGPVFLIFFLVRFFFFFGCTLRPELPRPGMEPVPLAMEAQSFNP